MSHVRRFDHVGITVADLDSATAFFVGLGLEIEGRMFLQGEFVDTVIGIPDSLSEIVMLRPPTEAPAWSCRASSGPTMSQGRPRRCPPNSDCATWRSRWTTFSRLSTGWPRTAKAWLAAWVNTRTSGAWPTCSDWRESSCPWPSGSVDAAGGEPDRLLVRVQTGRCAFSEVGPASVPNVDPLRNEHDQCSDGQGSSLRTSCLRFGLRYL